MRKFLKITLWIIGSLIFLLLGVVVCIDTPWGQNFIRGKAEAYLNNKIKTEVRIGHFGLGFPKFVVLKDVFFRDQNRDTLLLVGELKVDISMLKQLHKEVDVQQLLLTGVHSHIYRNRPDTTYNFSYILDAFAGKKPATPKAKDTSSSSLTINLDRVKLDDIHVHFDDYTGGMRLGVNLDHLDLDMKKLDMEQMIFHIKDLAIAGLQTTFSQDSSYLPPKPASNSKTKLRLIADNVNMQRVNFNYNDDLNKLLFALKLGDMQLQLNEFGLDDNNIDVKKLKLDNTSIVFQMGSQTTAPSFVDTLVKIDTTVGWHITAKDVAMSGVNFKMDNQSSPRQPSGMDYAHMYYKNTSLTLTDFLYTSDTIAGNVHSFAASEQCGLSVLALRTAFNYNPQGVTLNNLYLQTPTTILQNHVEVHYPSLTALQKNTASLSLNLNLKNSIVGLGDVLQFVPQLKSQQIFSKNRNGRLRVDAAITGALSNLNIANLYVAGLSNTELQVNGRLGGLPDANKLTYNLHISKFQTSRQDVSSLVPDSLLASVRLPDKFGAIGQVAGTTKDYNTDLYFASTDGIAYIKGSVITSPGNEKATYDMHVRTLELNVGHIIKKDSLVGIVNADLDVKGQGFDVKTMAAKLDGTVSSAFVKGYRYHNISFDGKMANKAGDLDFTSVDTNLQVKLTAHGDFSGKNPAVKANIQLDSIDLRALKLYGTDLRLHGKITADFPDLNADYPRGQFTWALPIINANGKRYYLDSMYVISRPGSDTGQNIIANLDVVQAVITGHTPLSKVGDIVMEHINRHYSFPVDSTKKSIATAKDSMLAQNKIIKKDTTKIPDVYDLKVFAHVIDKPMLHGILPGLTSFDSIHVDGTLSQQSMALKVLVPDLIYSGTDVQNGVIMVNSVDSAFTYSITADEIKKSSVDLFFANIHGNLDQNTINTNISISDASKNERFALVADIHKTDDTQVVHLQKGLKLNYNAWDVTDQNRIVLAGGGFYIQNFGISNKDQSIKANNEEPRINTPLKVDINNFLLANFTELVSSPDTLLANGVLAGNVTLNHMTPTMDLTGDLAINNLQVLGDTLGNLKLQVATKDNNALDTKLTINGQGNDISLNGDYYLQTTNGNDFNFDLGVKALAVHSFESIAQHQIKNTTGYVRGDLKLSGTTSSPMINGELHTDNLVTNISQLNAVFKMPAEKITFSNNLISFNNFSISDSGSNKAVINGTLNTEDMTAIQMNLNVKADKWRALHSTAKDNKDFYGDLLLTTHLDIKGTASAPSIDGDLNILKGTNFTVVTPESTPQVESSKGIVMFLNMKDTGRKNVLVPHKTDTAKARHKLAAGSDINVNVTIDKAAVLSLILDQSSGDFLSVRGDASLNAAVTPGGTISLTGTYDLHGGAYQLNYNFIKRKFLIQDGSSITFAGDPVKGTILDVTAAYEAEAPPYDLIQREVTDQTQLNYYKQNLPFEVDLHLKGPVLEPSITFDVQLPDNKVYPLSADQIELVQGKLNQIRMDTAELNKQVFAVLILGRFVSDDPFSSGASNGVGFTALQSVSTFIGEQLNQAAGKLVKGLDISADLATTADYTTGDMRQRTDLNLAASKELLNDRLKLTIGNDFELEGPQTNNNSNSSYVPTNLAADYLLSPGGKYSMRAYRKEYDEGVLEGFVTETGVVFIVNIDYNHFRNVFKKAKTENTAGK